MGTLRLVNAAPKGLHWKVDVDDRGLEDHNEELLFEWVRTNVKGSVVYFRTQFGNNTTRRAPSRQRHFNSGYYVYSFWFTKKADAALFRFWWCL